MVVSAVHGASAAFAEAEIVGVGAFDFLAAFLYKLPILLRIVGSEFFHTFQVGLDKISQQQNFINRSDLPRAYSEIGFCIPGISLFAKREKCVEK